MIDVKLPICWVLATALLASGRVLAQEQAPPAMDDVAASIAMRRFPQAVRAGDLIGRTLIRPLESQDVVGRVTHVVRSKDGAEMIVLDHGGLFGFGARSVALPLDAVALLGADVVVLRLTPEQLSQLPAYDGGEAVPVAPEDMVRIGLTGPAH